MKTIKTPLSFDEMGRPRAVVSTTVTRDKTRAEVEVAPYKAIPIVLLPGIMGTPLLSTNPEAASIMGVKNEWAWFSDNVSGWMISPLKTTKSFKTLTPSDRKALLNVEGTRALHPTENGDRSRLYVTRHIVKEIQKNLKRNFFAGGLLFSHEEAMNRGWGTVAADPYAEVLVKLEQRLRHLTHYGHAVDASNVEQLEGFKNVFSRINNKYPEAKKTIFKGYETEAERLESQLEDVLRYTDRDKEPIGIYPYEGTENEATYKERLLEHIHHAANYHYPVFAVGYNWLQSNKQSAEDVYKRITEQIIPHVSKNLGWACDGKVILVTHSMGGLVGRALAKKYPEIIKGVFHNVQPCNGAAAVYYRMHAGWEGWPAGPILASTGSHLVPILGNSPGGLELLPNKNYGSNWLQFKNKNVFYSLPSLSGDPYEEIYLKKGFWYNLVTPKDLAPEAPKAEDGDDVRNNAWEDYAKLVQSARNFHQYLNGQFFDTTFFAYSKSNKRKAFGNVVWDISLDKYQMATFKQKLVLEQKAVSLEPLRRGGGKWLKDAGETLYTASLLGADSPGDGTVPYFSANPPTAQKTETPEYLKQTFDYSDLIKEEVGWVYIRSEKPDEYGTVREYYYKQELTDDGMSEVEEESSTAYMCRDVYQNGDVRCYDGTFDQDGQFVPAGMATKNVGGIVVTSGKGYRFLFDGAGLDHKDALNPDAAVDVVAYSIISMMGTGN